MRSEDLLRQLSDIDDKYIEEAAPDTAAIATKDAEPVVTPMPVRKSSGRSFRQLYIFAGVAAAAVIAVLSLRVFNLIGSKNMGTAPASDMAKEAADAAPEAPAYEAAMSEEAAATADEAAVGADAEEYEEEIVSEESAEDYADNIAPASEEASEAPASVSEKSDERMKNKQTLSPERGLDSKVVGADSTNGEHGIDIMREVTPEEIKKNLGREFVIPVEATDVILRMSGTDLALADFELEGSQCSLKMQKSDGFEDISGLYYNWDSETDIKINGKDAKLYKYGKVSCCMWYDEGIMYSVSVIGDVDVDILAEAVFK